MRLGDLRGNVGAILAQERIALEWGRVGFRLGQAFFFESQLYAIKYGGNRRLALDWGRWLAGTDQSPIKDAVLIPVPLHWRRRVHRGYNQAAWIAKGISQVWNVPVCANILVRARHGASLTGMGREVRELAMAGAYTLRGGTTPGQAVILVDDVLTSGTTLRACQAACEGGGLKVVGAVALALA